MSERVLESVFGAAAKYGPEVTVNDQGKILNRSTVYAWVDRLPPEVKVRDGKRLKINLPKLQEIVDAGGWPRSRQ